MARRRTTEQRKDVNMQKKWVILLFMVMALIIFGNVVFQGIYPESFSNASIHTRFGIAILIVFIFFIMRMRQRRLSNDKRGLDVKNMLKGMPRIWLFNKGYFHIMLFCVLESIWCSLLTYFYGQNPSDVGHLIFISGLILIFFVCLMSYLRSANPK